MVEPQFPGAGEQDSHNSRDDGWFGQDSHKAATDSLLGLD